MNQSTRAGSITLPCCKPIAILAALVFLAPLAACSIEDDFGRLHRPLIQQEAADIVGSIQEQTGILSDRTAYHIPLTNNEHQLRRSLTHFRHPFLYAPTIRDPQKRQTFAKHRTGPSFTAFMRHRIKADIAKIRSFNYSVGVVIEQDMQRYDVLASSYSVSNLDDRYMRVRIRENRAVTIRVMQLLDRRISDYDQAIEYARLQYPERHLLPLAPAMDRLRSEDALLKSKYERYIFQSASTKFDFSEVDRYPPRR